MSLKRLNQENTAWFGRRVMLGKTYSGKLLSAGDIRRLSLWRICFSDSTRKKYAFYIPFFLKRYHSKRGILGCNWGVRKSTILTVNGFDEDYIRAGIGEDLDIEWRLRQNGCNFVYMPQHAIVYHLHHDSNYSMDDVNFNLSVCKKKQAAEVVVCKNGLNSQFDVLDNSESSKVPTH